MDSEVVSAFASLGGTGLFAWVVYSKLKEMADSFRALSNAVIKMEERGVRLARPTPPHEYLRPPTTEPPA